MKEPQFQIDCTSELSLWQSKCTCIKIQAVLRWQTCSFADSQLYLHASDALFCLA